MRGALLAIVAAIALWAATATPVFARGAITVRVGTHRGYTRLVFDLKRPVPFHVWNAGAAAAITFAAPLQFDAEAFAAARPRILAGHAVARGHDTVVNLALAKGMTLRYFRDGVRLVVDAVGPTPAPAPRAAMRGTAQRAEKKAPPRAATKIAARNKTAAEADRRKAVPPHPKRGTMAAAPNAEPQPAKPSPSGQTLAKTPATPAIMAVPVAVTSGSHHLELTFSWPEPVAAAVFERAGWLWIAFDHPARFDIAALGQHGMPIVWRAMQLANAKAAILRMRVAPAWTAAVEGTDTTWRIDLVPAATATPPVSIPVEIQPRAVPAPQIFFAVPEAGQILTLADPAVGDRLTVVTVGKPGLGLAAPRHFAQFSLLGAPQGLAMTRASDKIDVTASPTGVAVRATGGLLLSTAPLGFHAGPTLPDVLLHFGPRWAGPPEHFEATKQKLQFTLVEAPAGGLTEARYALAEFFFANGLYAEAEGVLDRLVARAPIEATRPRFQLLHGAVLFGLRRFKEAAREFAKPGLAQQPEAALWLGACEAAERDWKSALGNLKRGHVILAAYPSTIRARFELAIAHAELDTGDPAEAQKTLILLRTEHPEPATRADSNYLSGVAAQEVGKIAEARGYYHKAVSSDRIGIRVRGRLALTEIALKANQMTAAEAIKRLDALRFVWRGGFFEDRLLRVLGGLYLDQHRYRKALTTWRTVVNYFPKFPHTAEIDSRMHLVFLQLFLKGGAKQLSALKAIGLFYDFRDLTPNTPEGDTVVRHLARRLVSVDLLSQAEDLLRYQMTYRLSPGTEKARVGVQLGKVYLLDQQPKMTLGALKDSATPSLPEALTETRRNLKVAALIELGRYDDAIQALAGATDATAAALRAGIYWRARKWPEEAATLSQILGQRYADQAPLSATERLDVLRLAVALVMSGNNTALNRLRAQYAPRLVGTPQAEPFRAVTEKIGGAGTLPSSTFIANLDQLQSFLAHYQAAPETAG